MINTADFINIQSKNSKSLGVTLMKYPLPIRLMYTRYEFIHLERKRKWKKYDKYNRWVLFE